MEADRRLEDLPISRGGPLGRRRRRGGMVPVDAETSVDTATDEDTVGTPGRARCYDRPQRRGPTRQYEET